MVKDRQTPMPSTFHSFALVGRDTDIRVADSMRTLAAHLSSRGGKVLVDENGTADFGTTRVTPLDPKTFADQANLLIAIGGDGTMLFASRLVVGRNVPLLGVNRGRLGFLTDVSPDDMLERLDDVLAGNFTEDRRSLLEARLMRNGRALATLTALNDVVVQKLDRRVGDRLNCLRSLLRRPNRPAATRCCGPRAHFSAHTERPADRCAGGCLH